MVENENDVAKLKIPYQQKIAYVTQTTLSLDDTKNIVDAIKSKYLNVIEPKKMIFAMQQPIDKMLLRKFQKNVICSLLLELIIRLIHFVLLKLQSNMVRKKVF